MVYRVCVFYQVLGYMKIWMISVIISSFVVVKWVKMLNISKSGRMNFFSVVSSVVILLDRSGKVKFLLN